ncbi:MAG: sulfatase-like hydrolase/transferase [Verrucomicrobiota bacterium]|jgi:arylsulfatase A-like enzyme|nr:sulfatase-like hydrolase/transferase [Verrucomicrobiota bacterium]
MTKRTLTLLVALIGAIASTSAAAAAKRPNVLFIFTDDQRPDAFGALGNPDIRTPNMDRIINSGFVFNQAYIQGSMTFATCLPSRAMIMSGKPLFRAPLQLDSGVLMPQVFQKAGYRTFCSGKWHNGELSFEKCFDEAEAVFFGGAARTHVNVPVHRMIAGLMVPYDAGETFSTDLFADAAIDFIERESKTDQPFFCYIPFTAPHSPVTPPGKWATMYDPKKIMLPPNHSALRPDLADKRQDSGRRSGGRGGRGRQGGDTSPVDRAKQQYATYYGLISHLDHHIGRVLDTLEKTGQADNTIVLFATDHGMAMNSHGQSGKHNAYEHTTRVQIFASGAGVPKGSSDALVYLYDIYPTLCGLTGLPIPGEVEGKNLAGVIHGKQAKVRDHLFTAYMDDQRTIRDDRWKMFYRPKEDRAALYDLKNDPHELSDLAAKPEHSERIAALKTALAKAQQQYGDTPEVTARLMRSRGGRPGGAGGRRPAGAGVIARPTVDASALAKRVTEKFLAHSKAESGLAKGKFQEIWTQLHAAWAGDEKSVGRPDLIQGFAKLLGEQPSERGGRIGGQADRGGQRRPADRFGGPIGPSGVIARAFSYATDSDGDREITAEEVQSAAEKWSGDGDKNSDGKLSADEISSVIEGFIQSMPASRGRRR